jgi:asparagine synthase (glutamine-hydrolysing)
MCGIAGFFHNKSNNRAELALMLDSLKHRGPDQQFEYHNNNFSMGMTRLSINDLFNGAQPFYSNKKTIAVIYNGEIYNYRSLRKDLELRGKKFVTNTDGEVIAHLYDVFGESALGYLDGMFAVAIWDLNTHTLVLGRDFPGEKPLYYYNDSHAFAFASEIKALRSLPFVKLTLNRQAIWDFPTFLWVPESNTVFNQILAVPAGHILTISDSGVKVKRYKYMLNSDIPEDMTDKQAVELTRSIVEQSINDRLLSDVPVGSFLSGGLDSSIVATIASKKLDQLDTFTVAFDNIDDPYHGKADESISAIETSKIIGSRHHTVKVNSSSLRHSLDDFCKYGDQPFSVSSGLGILAIAHAASQSGIKVLLTGDGADECFGGYSWYEHLATLKNKNNLYDDSQISFQSVGYSVNDRLELISKMNPQQRAWAWHYYAHENEKIDLFSNDWSEDLLNSNYHFSSLNKDSTNLDYIKHDRDFYFPNEMLTKVDRMLMAYSVEGRTPFAARSVQQLANHLSIKQMVSKDNLKWVLRKAFEDILPMDVINRPKHGFNIPIDYWLNNEWSDMVEEAFVEGSMLHNYGIINRDSYSVALRLLSDENRLNGHTIFSMIMLNKWLGQ